MIVAENLTMKFEGKTALDGINCTIPSGVVYGMVGSNGAGKSTFLRLLTGIYRPAEGTVTFDGKPVYENPEVKERIAFVPDDLFFIPQSNMKRMAQFYKSFNRRFSDERFNALTTDFGLDPKAPIRTFSKGMKRQAAIILALSCMPDYLFLDETYDGLDPVVRMKAKKVIYDDVIDRKMTVILASHSLRELEDTCDKLALLHRGGIVFESDVQDIHTTLFKVQVAFKETFSRDKFDGINILSYTQNGAVASLIVRGNEDEVKSIINKMNPLLLDILPLSLEEVFIFEMEALGYSADGLI